MWNGTANQPCRNARSGVPGILHLLRQGSLPPPKTSQWLTATEALSAQPHPRRASIPTESVPKRFLQNYDLLNSGSWGYCFPDLLCEFIPFLLRQGPRGGNKSKHSGCWRARGTGRRRSINGPISTIADITQRELSARPILNSNLLNSLTGMSRIIAVRILPCQSEGLEHLSLSSGCRTPIRVKSAQMIGWLF